MDGGDHQWQIHFLTSDIYVYMKIYQHIYCGQIILIEYNDPEAQIREK